MSRVTTESELLHGKARLCYRKLELTRFTVSMAKLDTAHVRVHQLP